MTTRRANKAAAFQAQMAAEDQEEKARLSRWRDDACEKITALKAKRDADAKFIDEVAAQQKSSSRTMFAELIATEERRRNELTAAIAALEGEESAEGQGTGHNSDGESQNVENLAVRKRRSAEG